MPNEENQTISKDDIINDWGSGYYRKGTMLNDIIKDYCNMVTQRMKLKDMTYLLVP